MCMSLESLLEEGERSWVALSSVTRYLIIVSYRNELHVLATSIDGVSKYLSRK